MMLLQELAGLGEPFNRGGLGLLLPCDFTQLPTSSLDRLATRLKVGGMRNAVAR